MTQRNRTRRTVAAAAIAVAALILSACGGGSGSDSDSDKVLITADPSAIPAFIAQEEGFFEGVDVEISTAGYDNAASLLISGDSQIAWMNPLETAQMVSEGEDLRYINTSGGLNMYNGVIVRAEDADKYKSVADLKGKKLGIPGFGTGTWANFAVFAKMFYGVDDARKAYDTATADSGALLALLEKGEIDAALLFAADSAASRYSDKFATVFSFTEVMQEELGQPLVVSGCVATADWIKDNGDKIDAVTAGMDRAVEWMKENPQELNKGGKYEDLAEEAGWYTSEEATDGILKLLGEGTWFLTSEAYTDEWREAVYEVVKGGEGELVESVPALDDFLAPAK